MSYQINGIEKRVNGLHKKDPAMEVQSKISVGRRIMDVFSCSEDLNSQLLLYSRGDGR